MPTAEDLKPRGENSQNLTNMNEVGELVEIDANPLDDEPFRVVLDGRGWWYREGQLMKAE